MSTLEVNFDSMMVTPKNMSIVSDMAINRLQWEWYIKLFVLLEFVEYSHVCTQNVAKIDVT